MNQSMSLSQFRKHLFTIFQLMKDTNISMKVAHRRKIYNITVEATTERVTTPYRKSRTSVANKIDPSLTKTDTCDTCGDITFNGVCMNVKCPTSKKGSSVQESYGTKNTPEGVSVVK